MSFIKSSYDAYKLVEALEQQTQEREVSMARSNAAAILDKSIILRDILTKEPNKAQGLKPWIESKITTATNNVVMIHDYLKYYPTIKAKYKEIKEEVTKDEVDMVIASLNNMIHKSNEIGEMMVYMRDHNTELEPWVSSKLQTAKDNVSAVYDYMVYNPDLNESTDLTEREKKFSLIPTSHKAAYHNMPSAPLKKDTYIGDLKGQISSTQLANIKKDWANKTKNDLTPELLKFIAKLDLPTRVAIGQANINVLSKLVKEEVDLEETSLSSIHKMKEDGKTSEEIAKELKLNASLVKKILGEEVELEEIELKEFTDAEIAQLKKEFDPLKGKQISTARANQLSNILNKLDDGSLDKLKSALIPFVSALAAAKTTQRKFRDVKITNIKVPGLEGMAEETAAEKLQAKQKKNKIIQQPQIDKTAADVVDVTKPGGGFGPTLAVERKIVDTVNMEEKDEFKPHYMYEPKTGKKEWVTTMAKHLELDKKGWGHESVKEEKNCGCGQTPCITYGKQVDEHIVKVKGGYELKSKSTGKNLGTYPTKAGAEKRERQVQYFKHVNESVQEAKEATGNLKDACWTGYTAVGFKMKNGKRVPNCVPKSEAYKGAKKVVENAFKKIKGKK